MFYLKLPTMEIRTKFIEYFKDKEIITAFHYIPLHSTLTGSVYGRFFGEDVFTTVESERLVRIPLWYGMKQNDVETVIETIHEFIKSL